jgi:hypothetical protein
MLLFFGARDVIEVYMLAFLRANMSRVFFGLIV